MEWLTTLFQAFAKPFQWWVTVAPWERGLRIRLGKTAADLAPGIHFRIPFLDRVHVQSIRLRSVSDHMLTVCSRDGHAMTIGIAIDFAIGDLREMFNALSSPDVTLRLRAAAALAAYVAGRDKQEITAAGCADAVTQEIRGFGCGLSEIRARVVAFSFARPLRILMNETGWSSGLHHGFDRDPVDNT